MVERIVLHTGMHKTGTTAIQASLGESYDSLIERGVLYPRAGRSGVGHAGLTNELVHTDAPVPELPTHLAILEEAFETRPTSLIISAEGLSVTSDSRPVDWASHLCEALQPREVHVLAYVRPQWDYVESQYAQVVKAGGTWTPFEPWLEVIMSNKALDYCDKFGLWSQAFDRLELRPYRPDLLLEGDAVTDFWDAVGLGTPPEARVHANPRTGVRTTEMLRLLRAFLADHRLESLLPPPARPHPRPQEKAVQDLLHRVRRRIEAALPDDQPFAPLTQEMAAQLALQFANSNQEFVRNYLGGRHGDLFSPPSERRQVSTWTMDEATVQERRVFARVVEYAMSQLRSSPEGRASPRRQRRPRRSPVVRSVVRLRRSLTARALPPPSP